MAMEEISFETTATFPIRLQHKLIADAVPRSSQNLFSTKIKGLNYENGT